MTYVQISWQSSWRILKRNDKGVSDIWISALLEITKFPSHSTRYEATVCIILMYSSLSQTPWGRKEQLLGECSKAEVLFPIW